MDGKAIVDRWRLDHWPHLAHEEIVGTDALVRAIDAALAQSRAEEREAILAELYASGQIPVQSAIAHICDDSKDPTGALLGRVRDRAIALRARGTP